MKKTDPRTVTPKMNGIWQKKAAYFLLLTVLTMGVWFRLHNFYFDTRSTLNRSPDEPMYTAYASVLAHEGLKKGTGISVREYNKNQKYWVYPPPTRIGYLYPLALIMRFTGRFDLDLGLYFSCATSVLSLLILAGIAIRFFNPWISLCACLFMAFSPMELALARKVWQDGLMTLAGGILVWLCFEVFLDPENWILFALYGLAGGYCLLIKESGVVLFGLCTVWLAIMMLRQQRLKAALAVIFAAFVSSLGSFIILVVVSGGIENILRVFLNFARSLPNNDYVVQLQIGPWYALLKGLFILSPFVTLLCAAGILSAVFIERRAAWVGTTFIFSAFVGIASIPQYFKNLRFLSPVYIPYFLLSGAGVWAIASLIRSKLRKPWAPAGLGILAIGMAAIAWADAASFDRIFVQNHTKDLVNGLLKEPS